MGAPGQKPPRDLPQIALAGRSNAGKSSLLNRLVGRKRIARASKQPGRTREINFFLVDERYMLADLPGYGFARAPKAVREGWGRLIEGYLKRTPGILGIVLLVDARRGLVDDDRRLVELLAALGTPALFALTKIDKLNKAGRRRAVEKLGRALEVDADQIVATSARAGDGVDTLRDSIVALVEQGSDGG